MSNNIEQTEAFRRAINKIKAEKQRQHEILHDNPPQNFKEVRASDAFNLGFPSTQAMSEEIDKHPKVFAEIRELAFKKAISYEEAEEELRKIADPNLISKVKDWQNLKEIKKMHGKEPGPPKIYINKHKSRPKTRSQVIAKYEYWKAHRELKIKRAAPLDDYPL